MENMLFKVEDLFRFILNIQIFLLIIFGQLSFSQQNEKLNSKITIDNNINRYEVKDEFNSFDDIVNNNYSKGLNINFPLDSEIIISNNYSSNFVGHDIYFRLNKNLELVDVKYNYWTDVVDLDSKLTYKVLKVDLKLNQNPFKKIQGFRGQYILTIGVQDIKGVNIDLKIFKGKFKTFYGIDENSTNYQEAVKINNMKHKLIDESGVYLKPDKKPILKSNYKELVRELKKMKLSPCKKLVLKLIIVESGKIDKTSIEYRTNCNFNSSLKPQLEELLFKLTEWYPACVNNKEVKSYTRLMIGLE